MSVLSKDAWQYVDLWLRRRGKVAERALVYWEQAHHFFRASASLPSVSSPLTSYYCFLNATKTLLLVKGCTHANLHGIRGNAPVGARHTLEDERVSIQRSGVLVSLSQYLNEAEPSQTHTLKDVLGNLPFIHRAYCLTYSGQRDRFIPLKNVRYVKKDGSREAWLCADISRRLSDGKIVNTLSGFELDKGVTDSFVIRQKQRFRWHTRGASQEEKRRAVYRLQNYHKKIRKTVVCISSPTDLWYINGL
jgi:hypothetical protein